jgi:transcriptional regulator with XRE-family HTH domain
VDPYGKERAARLKRFGQTLRDLREAKFPSQEAFALEAKMNRVHVHYLEQGKREPGLGTLMVLGKTLEVSLDELTAGLDAPTHRRPRARRRAQR